MGPFTDRQLLIMRTALFTEKESIRTDRNTRPSIRAIMMAECDVIIDAINEEVERLGTRSESDHQGG